MINLWVVRRFKLIIKFEKVKFKYIVFPEIVLIVPVELNRFIILYITYI